MTGFEAPRLNGHRPAIGAVIERVDSRGKHIEIGWDDGTILHTHMRMTGSWHLYRPGERWRKSTRSMRAVIEVEGFEAVCFNAPVVETFQAKDFAHHPGRRAALGPDLCDPDVDVAECVQRIPQFCDESTTAAELLLDQRVASGVGNVYKSEVLWACGVHPLTPVAALDVDTRRCAVGDGRRVPPGQPRPADPHDAPRQRRGRGGVRALRQAVLPVRHARSRSAATASSPG